MAKKSSSTNGFKRPLPVKTDMTHFLLKIKSVDKKVTITFPESISLLTLTADEAMDFAECLATCSLQSGYKKTHFFTISQN